jgi:ubiquinone/menaquinone biosynthesis C-methylase UbiE
VTQNAAASGARRIWAAGDYAKIAEQLEPAAAAVVARAAIEPGMSVLDVATGTGNAALLAADRGAHVTGVDLTPELLAQAEARAAAAGCAIDFREGNAQDLPVADESFDRVLSVFGVMFALDQQRAAAVGGAGPSARAVR